MLRIVGQRYRELG